MSWQLVSVICHRYQENAKVEAKILVPRRRVRALDNPLALVVRQPLIFSRFCQVEVALIWGTSPVESIEFEHGCFNSNQVVLIVQ